MHDWRFPEKVIGTKELETDPQHVQRTPYGHTVLFKATRGGLNANFLISCWPPLVALTKHCGWNQKLMFRQHSQTMLNKCCLNGPVPTLRKQSNDDVKVCSWFAYSCYSWMTYRVYSPWASKGSDFPERRQIATMLFCIIYFHYQWTMPLWKI